MEGMSGQFGDHDVVAEVELGKLEQVAVPGAPQTGLEIRAQRPDRVIDAINIERGEDGDPGTHTRVEIGSGSAPERAVEPIGAVMGDRCAHQSHGPEVAAAARDSPQLAQPTPPTLITDSASPRASQIRSDSRGSACRVAR